MRHPRTRPGYSVGIVLIVVLALLSTLMVFTWSVKRTPGTELWIFARTHRTAYTPIFNEWNAKHPEKPAKLSLLEFAPLERRLLSGLRSGTPLPALVEVERMVVGQTFAGPLEDIGYVDLTDRLKAGGWMERINGPSFGPWTTRGRIFGIPHDIHPVMLAYRADIIEGAGIDVSKIETWDDFARELAPLMAEKGADGRPKRYLINFWPTAGDVIEALLLQAGGNYFDRNDRPALDTEVNARVMAKLVTWVAGPKRIATDAQEFTAAGNKMRLDGIVLSGLVPDWLTGIWRENIPGLGGKLKLMPIPAWEKGGRRTSVWGGTMLAIPKGDKDAADIDRALEFGMHLYTSPELWDDFFRRVGIIPPFRDLWERPVYREPNPFFCGQPLGQLFIDQAPNVPWRSSSPFTLVARTRYSESMQKLLVWANQTGTYDEPSLQKQARIYLALAQQDVVRRVNRNAFLREETAQATTEAAP